MAQAALPIAAAGTVLSIFGQSESDKAEAKSLEQSALAQRKEAAEILRRSKINQDVTKLEGRKITGDQVSGFARAGVDVSSGSPLLVLEETAGSIRRETFNIGREASFSANQLLTSAGRSTAAASAIRRTSPLRAAGSLLGFASNFIPTSGPSTKGIKNNAKD